jgi:hypothetical protein
MVVHHLLYELLVFFSVVLVGGLLAFAHIHGEAGTPSLRIRSAAVGPNERSGSVSGRGALLFRRCKNTPLSLHSASSRLRTGESLHLACFWPSPTSMARREHHLCASGVRRWVRTNGRFCEWKGCIIISSMQKQQKDHYAIQNEILCVTRWLHANIILMNVPLSSSK